MIALLEEAIPNERKEEMYGFLEQQGANHAKIPQEHWYLPLIGVDPSQQGQGHGSALLEHTLARIDRARLPAYLEATNANNKRLYERHGFEEVGVIQYGGSPPMWPMLRKAR
jgi:ribosomal protein S18 acetylase RimI-like enzyme